METVGENSLRCGQVVGRLQNILMVAPASDGEGAGAEGGGRDMEQLVRGSRRQRWQGREDTGLRDSYCRWQRLVYKPKGRKHGGTRLEGVGESPLGKGKSCCVVTVMDWICCCVLLIKSRPTFSHL